MNNNNKMNNENIREMQKQTKVYSVNTKAFYINKEKEKYNITLENKIEMNYIQNYIFLNMLNNDDLPETDEKEINAKKRYDKQLEEYREFALQEFIEICRYKAPANYKELEGEELEEAKKALNTRIKITRYVKELINRNKKSKNKGFNKLFNDCLDAIEALKEGCLFDIVVKYKALREENKALFKEINSLINQNDKKRELDETRINKYKAVAIFDSFFLRTIKADDNLNSDDLNEDIIIVKVKSQYIMQQLLEQGFTYKSEDYIYYTSSAGQIRDKKLVYIKKSVYEKYEKTLMCGLTEADINEQGGINTNKYLAYKALTMSSTTEWTNDMMGGFDIKKTIVLPDFETEVTGIVDYIDKESFSITKQEMDINIEHSDGAGWVLSSKSNKNFMFRSCFIKGLLTPVNFLKYCEEENGGNYKVVDIYGKEWDLLEDKIEVVFFKSQFKLHKYYKDWAEYQDAFIDNNCHASICNVESDSFEKASMCYQMWQSLSNMTEKEVQLFTNRVKSKIESAYKNRDKMLEMLKVNKDDSKNKTYLQKILKVYPELLAGDPYLKSCISDSITSMKNKAKQGKIEIDAKYTYVLPDTYAWLQYSISGIRDIEKLGILADGEVSCKLYKKSDELAILRSPSLSREIGIRKNIVENIDKKKIINKYLNTNAIYTSTKDLISKLLQFDVDGDKLLVVAEKSVIEIGKRHNEQDDIVSLFYEMGQAEPVEINPDRIFEGLTSAFKFGNVGTWSNKITKLWNAKDIDMEYIKINTALSNYSIDASKTLEMVNPPKWKQEEIDEYMKELKMPYFFKFVKDYNEDKVEQELDKNFTSTVNKFVVEVDKIGRGTYSFENCGTFRKSNLMNNSKIEIDKDLIEFYDDLNGEMQKYMFIDVDGTKEEKFNKTIEMLRDQFEQYCVDNKIEFIDAVDMIIQRIYTTRKDSNKKLLFEMLGDQILINLKNNIKKPLQDDEYFMCQKCGTRVKRQSNSQKYCKKCK